MRRHVKWGDHFAVNRVFAVQQNSRFAIGMGKAQLVQHVRPEAIKYSNRVITDFNPVMNLVSCISRYRDPIQANGRITNSSYRSLNDEVVQRFEVLVERHD